MEQLYGSQVGLGSQPVGLGMPWDDVAFNCSLMILMRTVLWCPMSSGYLELSLDAGFGSYRPFHDFLHQDRSKQTSCNGMAWCQKCWFVHKRHMQTSCLNWRPFQTGCLSSLGHLNHTTHPHHTFRLQPCSCVLFTHRFTLQRLDSSRNVVRAKLHSSCLAPTRDWCPAMPFRLQPGSTSLDLGEESEEDSVLLDLDRYWISGICSLADGFADAVQFAHFGVVFHHVATWQQIHTAIEVTYLAWKMLSVPIHCKSCKWQTDSQCKENDNPPRKARKTLKEDEEDAKPGMSSLVRIHHDMLY